MRRQSLSLVVVAGLALAMLVSHTSATEAQLSDARLHVEHARSLQPIIVDEIAAGKLDEAAKDLAAFKDDMDVVEAAIYNPAKDLQETDRNVLLPKVTAVKDQLGSSRSAGGTLKIAVDEGKEVSSSLVSDFQDEWKEFDNRFNQLSEDFKAYWTQMNASWKEMNDRMKEMNDRIQKFQAACGRDCS
jgi:hypothetical protein